MGWGWGWGLGRGKLVGARFVALRWLGVLGGPLWVLVGVSTGIWWLVVLGFVLLMLWVLRLRAGVTPSDGRIVVVQNSFQRIEVTVDDLVGVDGTVRFWSRAPHLELRNGARVRVVAFGAQRWLGSENEDAIDLARELDVPYRAD